MITIKSMSPATAPTRMRALVADTAVFDATVVYGSTVVSGSTVFGTVGRAAAHVDTRVSWSPLTAICESATTSRENLVGATMSVRPDAAAGMGAVPAGAEAGNDNTIGRKQGRPPRDEPR